MSTDFYLPHAQESIHSQRNFQAKSPILFSLNSSSPMSQDFPEERLSSWCTSHWKRAFDLSCVVPALILISPFLGILAIAVRITSKGPIIFRQERAGQHRKPFIIYKFRTMVENSEALGPEHTAKGDPRITMLGKCLRKLKLDELPQLFNVLRGEMSLVGPRPKLPHHDQTHMRCKPGVTGAATLAFRKEQHILCEVPQENLEDFYQEYVVPRKVVLDSQYMAKATFLSDIGLLIATLLRVGDYLTHRDIYATSNRSLESSPVRTHAPLQSN